jgi:hypothetical protein|tara:strand:+ start:355 stop:831 length:477 start_codon:yes stop_codon:yes gene_type:complete
MKLDKETLMQIIKEELEAVLDESVQLKKFRRAKDSELLKTFKKMGKPARKTFNDLKKHSPHQLTSIGQALVPEYPGTFVDTVATSGYKAGALTNDVASNPYGGRFFYTFEPEDTLESGARKGSISLFTVPPQTGELEFVTAYAVEDVDEELKKLAEKG